MKNSRKYGVEKVCGIPGEQRPHMGLIFKNLRLAEDFAAWLNEESD